MQDLGSSRAMLEIQYENEVPVVLAIILISTVWCICLERILIFICIFS